MPFFADYSFHPWTGMELFNTYKGEQKVKLLATDKIIKKQAKMMTFLQDQLAWTQDKQIWFANWDCQPYPNTRLAIRFMWMQDILHQKNQKNHLILRTQSPEKSAESSIIKHTN